MILPYKVLEAMTEQNLNINITFYDWAKNKETQT